MQKIRTKAPWLVVPRSENGKYSLRFLLSKSCCLSLGYMSIKILIKWWFLEKKIQNNEYFFLRTNVSTLGILLVVIKFYNPLRITRSYLKASGRICWSKRGLNGAFFYICDVLHFFFNFKKMKWRLIFEWVKQSLTHRFCSKIFFKLFDF